MPLVAVKCNSDITCICPICWEQRKLNELNKYSKHSFNKCYEEVVNLLKFRPTTYFSITEIVSFLKLDRVIITKVINTLVESKQLVYEHRYQGLDGRKVKCYRYNG